MIKMGHTVDIPTEESFVGYIVSHITFILPYQTLAGIFGVFWL